MKAPRKQLQQKQHNPERQHTVYDSDSQNETHKNNPTDTNPEY